MSDATDRRVVLVADDDDDIRNIICSSISIMGHMVLEASNGPESLGKISETETNGVVFWNLLGGVNEAEKNVEKKGQGYEQVPRNRNDFVKGTTARTLTE